MGIDIHGVWQRYDGAQWVDVESTYDQRRHQQLFAALAGVCNGVVRCLLFDDLITGEEITPIAPPRGLPADFLMDGEYHPIADVRFQCACRRLYFADGAPLAIWMGYEAQSWLSGEEMLAWYRTAPTIGKTGILSRAHYTAWDHRTPPKEYSHGVSGPQVLVIDDTQQADLPAWTHLRVYWAEDLHVELAFFFDEVARLVHDHGQIRFVFGFDS